jgi:hypothetical protein
MSEPTSGGNQVSDAEGQPESNQGVGESEQPASGSVFSDPTAPVWADPTAPLPASTAPEGPSVSPQDSPSTPPVTAPPVPPGAPYPPFGQQPAADPQPPPPPAPPMTNPYAQQPPTDPYGQSQHGQPAGQYGQPQYGQQYPAYGQSPYATGATAPSNTSAIILTIVSGVSMLSSAFLVGIPSLIFGIMALTSNTTDPLGSRKKSRTGWIIFAVNAGVVALLVILAVIAFVILGTSTSNVNSGA